MPMPGVTILSCVHTGLPDVPAAAGLELGWVAILSGLKTLLETVERALERLFPAFLRRLMLLTSEFLRAATGSSARLAKHEGCLMERGNAARW